MVKVPVYKKVVALEEGDVVRLGEERTRLNQGNLLQAILNSVAATLMILAFIG